MNSEMAYASNEKCFLFATSLQSRNENGDPDSDDSDLTDDEDDDNDDEDGEFGNRVQCSPS